MLTPPPCCISADVWHKKKQQQQQHPTYSFIFKGCPRVWWSVCKSTWRRRSFVFSFWSGEVGDCTLSPEKATECRWNNKRQENRGWRKRELGRKRGIKEGRNRDFTFLAAERKWAIKGGSTLCCVSACRAEASYWPPVSLAKNKPGRREEDSSPLSICIFPSFVSSILLSSSPPIAGGWLHTVFVFNTSAARYDWAQTGT